MLFLLNLIFVSNFIQRIVRCKRCKSLSSRIRYRNLSSNGRLLAPRHRRYFETKGPVVFKIWIGKLVTFSAAGENFKNWSFEILFLIYAPPKIDGAPKKIPSPEDLSAFLPLWNNFHFLFWCKQNMFISTMKRFLFHSWDRYIVFWTMSSWKVPFDVFTSMFRYFFCMHEPKMLKLNRENSSLIMPILKE